jgi:hypothetical protein
MFFIGRSLHSDVDCDVSFAGQWPS